jgi:hypothetical protein
MVPATKLMTAITIRLAANTAEGSRGTSPVLRNSKPIGSVADGRTCPLCRLDRIVARVVVVDVDDGGGQKAPEVLDDLRDRLAFVVAG